MENKWDYNRCAAILNTEAELIKRIFAVQNSIRKAVVDREWIDFDWKMDEARQLGEEFAQLDAERAALFASLAAELFKDKGNNGPVPFYTLAARMPENERREITGLYRSIKMETLKMKAMNESFLVYLNEAKTAASAYLEAAFPARGGKLYTHKGAKTDQDLKSIVFNRHI